MREFDICGIGSVMVDYISRADSILGPESKGFVRSEQRFVGGVTLNHLCWARVLGLNTAVFGIGADDAEGDFIRQGLDQFGVNHDYYLKTGPRTGTARIFVDPRGERAIYMNCGANFATRARDLEPLSGLPSKTRFISTEISQLKLEVVLKVLQMGRQAGCGTFLDLDMPPSIAVKQGLGSHGQLSQTLKNTNYLKSSLDAAVELVPRQAPEKMALALHRKLGKKPGREWVALTAGAAGCAISDGRQSLAVAGVKGIKVKDSTGAGDAFMGGLIAGVACGLGLKDLALLANATGAANVTRAGAVPASSGSREEILRRYKGGPFRLRDYMPPTSAGSAVKSPGRDFALTVHGELNRLIQHLDAKALRQARDLILASEKKGGRLHLTGIGKCSYAAAFAASSYSSTGTPAHFLDGTEATHGASGQVRPGDVVIAVSNSGETRELLRTVECLKRNGARILVVSRDPASRLARMSQVFLYAGVKAEGDRLGLAPRASVLAEMLVLSALGVELQEIKRFTAKDFVKYHPSGKLGETKS